MTPLTITISFSNYCQNHCPYCVSGSNSARWDPPGDWSKVPREDLLDVEALDRWLSTFTPGARLHISGGEPLLRPDVEDAVELLARRHKIVIFTNGQFVHKRSRLVGLSVSWLVTWHSSQVSLGEFVRQVEALRGKPVVARTVLVMREDIQRLEALKAALPWAAAHHAAWNRNARKSFPGFRPPTDENVGRVASQRLHLIVPRNGGEIWPCNSCAAACGPIGNLTNNWYSPERAGAMDIRARECVISNKCAAYQDAVLLNRWFGKEGIS